MEARTVVTADPAPDAVDRLNATFAGFMSRIQDTMASLNADMARAERAVAVLTETED